MGFVPGNFLDEGAELGGVDCVAEGEERRDAALGAAMCDGASEDGVPWSCGGEGDELGMC